MLCCLCAIITLTLTLIQTFILALTQKFPDESMPLHCGIVFDSGSSWVISETRRLYEWVFVTSLTWMDIFSGRTDVLVHCLLSFFFQMWNSLPSLITSHQEMKTFFYRLYSSSSSNHCINFVLCTVIFLSTSLVYLLFWLCIVPLQHLCDSATVISTFFK